MPKSLNYTLGTEELKAIQKAMKAKDGRTAKRATIIYNLHQGHSPQEVAQLHNVSVATVYNQFNAFKAEGVAGLPNKPKSGRPRKATPEYVEELEKTLQSEPDEYGYAFKVWTIARLREHLSKQTGIMLSRSRFQDLLTRLGYRYRRPKRDLGHKQDPLLREQVTQALDELKKTAPQAILNSSLWTKSPLD